MAYKFVNGDLGTGDNDGSSWANAWRTIIQANGVAAGDIVLVKGGTTYTAEDGATGACLNSSANGTLDAPVTYQGDDASGGAGEGNPSDFTLDADTNNLAYAAIPALFSVWKNVVFTGANTGGLYSTSADSVTCVDCNFHTNTGTGCRVDDGGTMINCTFHTNAEGFDADYVNVLFGCVFYNNSAYDAKYITGIVISCLFREDNNVTCLRLTGGDYVWSFGNTFDGYGDGIGLDFSEALNYPPTIMNNCFYDLALGIQSASPIDGNKARTRNNLFNSNDADTDANITEGEDYQTGAPNFVTEGSDYHPDTGSPLIDSGNDAGDA